jgi:membrane protein
MQILYDFIKIFLNSLQRFFTEKRLLWAASLTYTTIFSLIPLLSVLFFVFNIFGSLAEIKTMVQPYIYKTLAPWAQEKVIKILNDLVNNIDFSTIGVYSASLLIISVFLLLFEIEYALNEIWLIHKKTSALSRAAIYWALLTIGPVLLALSLFIFFTLQTYIPLKVLEVYVSAHGVSILSYILILSAFTLIYFLMPGTPVQLISALLGGFCAATLWKISGFAFTIYTSKFFFYYPKIFGSLAAIPLFLLWIFLCWLLFLFGAEFTYMHQNRFFYKKSFKTPLLENDVKSYLSLVIFLFIVQEVKKNVMPVSIKKIISVLKLPYHVTHELIETMLQRSVLMESPKLKNYFVPARLVDEMTIADIRSDFLSSIVIPDFCHTNFSENLHNAACFILNESAAESGRRNIADLLPAL